MLSVKALHLCVFVLFVDVFHAKEKDKFPLVRLAELQTEHCNEALFCTVRVLDEISPHQYKGCCPPCSCEAACVEEGTCCPDYHLIDSIGTNISNRISDFSNSLRNGNFTSIKQEQLTCLDLTEPEKFVSVYDRSKVTYKFVSSCPIVLNGNPKIKTKCEEPKVIGTFEYDLFIPVTSLKSGTTYRNIYCLLCKEESNGTTDVAYWTSIMYCRTNMLTVFNFATPHDYFTALQRNNLTYCYLVFSPNSDIGSGFELNRCEAVDVETCPEGSDKQLNEICQSFHLPVIDRSLRFRNIACFLCNNINQTLNRFCQIRARNIYKDKLFGFQLNIQRDDNNIVVHREEHEHHVLNVDVIEQENNECLTGFIQDTNEKGEVTCARVHCPWQFYISEGECIPIFTGLHNIMFTATLEVRRTEVFDQTMLDEIRNNYIKEVAKIGTNMFHKFTYGLWEVENDFDLLAVSFTTDQVNWTYIDFLQKYETFLDMVCIQTINANSLVVSVSTFHARSFLHSYTYISFLKPKPRRIYKYEDPRSSVTLMRLDIYMSHLCYRIARPKSMKTFFTYNRVTFRYLQTLKNDVLVCVDDAYKNLTDISSAFMFGGTCAQTTADFVQNKQNYKVRKTVNNINIKNTNNNNDADTKNNTRQKGPIVSNIDRRGSSDDEHWSDLATGLLVGGAMLAVIAIFVIVGILRIRTLKKAYVGEEACAQASQ